MPLAKIENLYASNDVIEIAARCLQTGRDFAARLLSVETFANYRFDKAKQPDPIRREEIARERIQQTLDYLVADIKSGFVRIGDVVSVLSPVGAAGKWGAWLGPKAAFDHPESFEFSDLLKWDLTAQQVAEAEEFYRPLAHRHRAKRWDSTSLIQSNLVPSLAAKVRADPDLLNLAAKLRVDISDGDELNRARAEAWLTRVNGLNDEEVPFWMLVHDQIFAEKEKQHRAQEARRPSAQQQTATPTRSSTNSDPSR